MFLLVDIVLFLIFLGVGAVILFTLPFLAFLGFFVIIGFVVLVFSLFGMFLFWLSPILLFLLLIAIVLGFLWKNRRRDYRR